MVPNNNHQSVMCPLERAARLFGLFRMKREAAATNLVEKKTVDAHGKVVLKFAQSRVKSLGKEICENKFN
jgi:hypothetical protein